MPALGEGKASQVLVAVTQQVENHERGRDVARRGANRAAGDMQPLLEVLKRQRRAPVVGGHDFPVEQQRSPESIAECRQRLGEVRELSGLVAAEPGVDRG